MLQIIQSVSCQLTCAMLLFTFNSPRCHCAVSMLNSECYHPAYLWSDRPIVCVSHSSQLSERRRLCSSHWLEKLRRFLSCRTTDSPLCSNPLDDITQTHFNWYIPLLVFSGKAASLSLSVQGCREYEISHPYPYPYPQMFRGYPWIYPYPEMPILCTVSNCKKHSCFLLSTGSIFTAFLLHLWLSTKWKSIPK